MVKKKSIIVSVGRVSSLSTNPFHSSQASACVGQGGQRMADDAERQFEEQLVEAAEGLEIPASYLPADDDYADDDDFLPGKDDALEYEPMPEVSLPDPVRNFLLQFARHIQNKSVYDLSYFYDSSFNKLTEKFYPKTPWPEPDAVATLTNDIVDGGTHHAEYFGIPARKRSERTC